ncbi:hypothetical protein PPTG_04414 [Phytophthora nicotianae INRA-310]|uniref:Peptidase S1 domain-containing protein n=1 Tax=Phytophthora nicotianae (strain INRA-310) TaxID=761204 RepID=W2R3A9_PHYN3|nr:hypothetical protein PPTG_04414 [Phytophthora nicotianae INRA-310]ETN18980.1 hypothetical protein PPTG_04414 [Phytophthora nicotianae INRA-310]
MFTQSAIPQGGDKLHVTLHHKYYRLFRFNICACPNPTGEVQRSNPGWSHFSSCLKSFKSPKCTAVEDEASPLYYPRFCDENVSERFVVLYNCGRFCASTGLFDDTDLTSDEESRIYSGSNADISKYSYVAKLIPGDMEDSPLCGGTLIALQYVLTSVYCLGWFKLDLDVSLGGQKNKDQGSQKSERIRAVEAFRHPLYNTTWFTYDVALLKLEKPSTHKPARLADADGSDAKSGTMATVFGWGEITYRKNAETLQSVAAKIIADDECGNYAIDLDVFLCAGTERGKGFCAEDTGLCSVVLALWKPEHPPNVLHTREVRVYNPGSSPQSLEA